MKISTKRTISLLLAALMLLLAAMPLTACGVDTPDKPECGTHADNDSDGKCDNCGEAVEPTNPDNPATGKSTYTVQLKTAGGRALDGVMVYVHKGTGYNSVGRGETDDNGKVTFELETANDYTVEIESSGLDGYNISDRYNFDGTKTAAITLVSAPITDDDIDSVDYYEVGDVIHDFTISDVDGNEWTVSEVLDEKQLLVLNYWYNGCSWCAKEFPYMASAYSKYSDRIEIFAINDYAANSFDQVKNYEILDTLGNPSSMPKFQVKSGPTMDKFIEDPESAGYPITVMIDRYGVICLIEIGATVSERPFTNAFDHFTAEYYEQKLFESISELTPTQKPNISMPDSSVIEEILNKDGLTATYRPEADDEYSWPFVPVDTDGNGEYDAIKPSNYDKDASYSIIYADVTLEKGEALCFEYLCSTQYQSDILYVLVNEKDIYSISGVSTDNKWEKCYPWVAQNAGTYELALVYVKDAADYDGDDTVYIRNMRGCDPSEIDVESYIYRYAATNPGATGDSYDTYAEVVLGSDGYYHVGDENGPLLLAHLLGYTLFDSQKTVFERLYSNTDKNGNYTFTVDGKEVFKLFEAYGSYASNSQIYGYCPVTEELRSFLEAYVQKYRQTTGMANDENLWLTLCSYYDAYGTDGKQLSDPIAGLASFSAYDVELDKDINVKYDKILVPRGYLYEFIPAVSGAYRITSDSESNVIGWVFGGNHSSWYGNGGYGRIEIVSSDISERFSNELYVVSYSVKCPECGAAVLVDEDDTEAVCPDPDCEAKVTDLSDKTESGFIDYANVSYVAYMEAGTPYYISIAFQDVNAVGEFTFDVKYLGESFDYFVSTSAGVFSAEGNMSGSIISGTSIINYVYCTLDGCESCADKVAELNDTPGKTYYHPKDIAGNVNRDIVIVDEFYTLCTDEECHECAEAATAAKAPLGTKYYHVLNPDGTQGSLIYADFYMYTEIFQSSSVLDMIKANYFTFDDGTDYNEKMAAYAEMMLNEDDYPERQGCVPVDEELAVILQKTVEKGTFEFVDHAWLKLCYYYLYLGK